MKYRIVRSLLLQREYAAQMTHSYFNAFFVSNSFKTPLYRPFFAPLVSQYSRLLCVRERWVTLLLHLFGEIEIYSLMSFIAVLFCGQCPPLPLCEIKCIFDFENLKFTLF